MTGKEIWLGARAQAPKIQLRDVWFLLRQLQTEGLVECLNPTEVTGRLYCYSDLGRQIAQKAFKTSIPLPPSDLDWNVYAQVARAKVRWEILGELGRDRLGPDQGLISTRLRKNLLPRHPLSKNATFRALKELLRLGLVEIVGETRKPRQKIHRLSEAGVRIHDFIQR